MFTRFYDIILRASKVMVNSFWVTGFFWSTVCIYISISIYRSIYISIYLYRCIYISISIYIFLYSLTRATLMSPGKGETRVCGYIYIYWKKMFFNFLGANFVAPKSGHQLEKQTVLGPTHGFSTFFLGATRNSLCSWQYVIWRSISTPTPLFQERHESFYEIFLSLI